MNNPITDKRLKEIKASLGERVQINGPKVIISAKTWLSICARLELADYTIACANKLGCRASEELCEPWVSFDRAVSSYLQLTKELP